MKLLEISFYQLYYQTMYKLACTYNKILRFYRIIIQDYVKQVQIIWNNEDNNALFK